MKICIIGGGHAGWWTAGYFEKHLPDYDLTVYETDEIPILGVGESTLPQIKIWFDELGIPEDTWMPEAQAIKKYGNYKIAWDQAGLAKPFTLYFWQNDDNAFDKMMNNPANYKYEPGKDRVINKKIFEEEFSKPQGWRDYAYHLDAFGAANIVKNHCKRTKIINETLDELPPGYDLYIDCTGFGRKFVQDKTEMPISKYHYVDRALVCPVKKIESDAETCLTKSIARRYGWQFEVCLKNRVGIGYVYSSMHVHPEDARLEYEHDMINGREKLLDEPRLIKWKPLVYANPWSNNVVAIGSSAGFVDPLEATALFMTQTGITTLVKCLKRGASPQAYNKLMRKTWKEGLDFQLAHYALNSREDTGFWRRMREIKDECSKMLWDNYHSKSNKYTNLFPSGIWCQLGVYLDDFKYYRSKETV